MIQLKGYQQRVLDSLGAFFRQCVKDGKPQSAFENIQRVNGFFPPDPYLPVPAAGLTNLPYVCLKVPTGGGKTLLACYAAGLAIDELLQVEHAVVLWLVPSNTILDQTAKALRDPRHAYRRALGLSCGNVEVFTIEEALHLSRAIVTGQTVVIVSTIQSFRVEDTTGRKVYGQNGAFTEHLLNLPADKVANLLPGADGNPKPSLANMLRLHHPIVIVDEAHNARTGLSFSTLGSLLPSCIMEFTATPDRTKNPSNVLHRVSAAELRAENMIKLPLRVVMREPSQRDQLLADAIALRSGLEKRAGAEAQRTGEYLRPIMLIQAERVDGCEPLRERMVHEFGIARDQVKISTGKLDELKSVTDIDSPKCPVRFIITVEKLREGWDCPFAYILCGLKETRSATAIEQIVGRILRLPGATPKQHPDLNCAYALSVSSSLPEVLNELREALESNGFTTAEAERIILPVSQGTLLLSTQERTIRFEPGAEIDADVAQKHVNSLGGKVSIDVAKGEIKILVPLSKSETEKVVSCVKSPEAKMRVSEAIDMVSVTERAFGGTGLTRVPTPFELRLDFVVPLLSIAENGQLFDFESTFLLEHPWRLSTKDASLPESYNPLIRPVAQTGTVDISADGRIQTASDKPNERYNAGAYQQPLALGANDWTIEELIVWLDRHIDHQDIPEGESGAFLLKALRGIMAKFSIEGMGPFVLDRFRLRDEIETLIQKHRIAERKVAFQKFLLPKSLLIVSEEHSLNFKTMTYEPSWLYDGSFQFRNHYFGTKPGELTERNASGELTEEFLCAQFIDQQPKIKFWVRNLARKNSSFRLHTSKDWFYPDFVCQLHDGRVLAVEYKGKHLFDASDAEEKRAVGAVWESRSNGRCLFVMPTDRDFTVIRRTLGTGS